MRCTNVISLKEVAEQSPEFDAKKIRCPKCGMKWLGDGVLEEERKQDKDKDKDKQEIKKKQIETKAVGG